MQIFRLTSTQPWRNDLFSDQSTPDKWRKDTKRAEKSPKKQKKRRQQRDRRVDGEILKCVNKEGRKIKREKLRVLRVSEINDITQFFFLLFAIALHRTRECIRCMCTSENSYREIRVVWENGKAGPTCEKRSAVCWWGSVANLLLFLHKYIRFFSLIDRLFDAEMIYWCMIRDWLDFF